MFEKDITRDIKGVIKVGQNDEENIYQELDEYVVTNELLKHFGCKWILHSVHKYAVLLLHNLHNLLRFIICLILCNASLNLGGI